MDCLGIIEIIKFGYLNMVVDKLFLIVDKGSELKLYLLNCKDIIDF